MMRNCKACHVIHKEVMRVCIFIKKKLKKNDGSVIIFKLQHFSQNIAIKKRLQLGSTN